MANTKNSTGRGRPAIGPRVEGRVPQHVADAIDDFAAKHGMNSAEAVRHLLATSVRIVDALATLDSLGRQAVEQIFTEAAGDADAIYDLLRNESEGSAHWAEILPDVASVEVDVMPARGYWVLVVNRGRDLNEHGHAGAWDRAFQVFTTAEAAREGFADMVVALTDEFWTADRTDADSLWCDFEQDRDLFIDLAVAQRIPKAAIDYETLRDEIAS